MSADATISSAKSPTDSRGTGIYLWAVGGVVLLLVQAQLRLGAIAWEAITSGQMTVGQSIICGLWVLLNGYAEGYRGFQKRFVPRVLARAHHLALHPSTFPVVLAPLFTMAYFVANRRAKIAAFSVTIAVIVAILLVRQLPQPWRGIVDAGVVAGLGWGTACLLWGVVQRLTGKNPVGNPDLPVSSPPAGPSDPS